MDAGEMMERAWEARDAALLEERRRFQVLYGKFLKCGDPKCGGYLGDAFGLRRLGYRLACDYCGGTNVRTAGYSG